MRFSVIMPLYNKAPYVRKALESVLAQSFRDFEIIVVDDGSHDNSFEIASSVLQASSIPYKLINQVNSGVSTARNNGVAASFGDFLCFLDADDWWESAFLERMDGFIDKYPEAGIYGTNYYYVKNGSKRICVTTADTGLINYCRVYAEKLQMPLWTGAVCMTRTIFDKFGGFRSHLKLGEDFDLWIKIALKYPVAFLNEPLSNYFQDADATWRGIGKLHNPQEHMLWNLDYLAQEETLNPDYKQLIDNLRSYNLLPYYISSQYRTIAKKELDKIDWSKQPKETQYLYQLPIPLLLMRQRVLTIGSRIKQWIINHL